MQIIDQTDKHRYELAVDGRLAGRLDYRLIDGNVIELVHTEIEPGFEGRGLASKIAQFAFEDARSHGRRVIATCEYIAAYAAKHPEHRDLLVQ